MQRGEEWGTASPGKVDICESHQQCVSCQVPAVIFCTLQIAPGTGMDAPRSLSGVCPGRAAGPAAQVCQAITSLHDED